MTFSHSFDKLESFQRVFSRRSDIPIRLVANRFVLIAWHILTATLIFSTTKSQNDLTATMINAVRVRPSRLSKRPAELEAHETAINP